MSAVTAISTLCWDYKLAWSFWMKIWQGVLRALKMDLLCDLVFLLVEVYPKETIKYLNKDLCTKMCDLYDL